MNDRFSSDQTEPRAKINGPFGASAVAVATAPSNKSEIHAERWSVGRARRVLLASWVSDGLGWRPIGHQAFASFRDVTRFMLSRAMALRSGIASGAAPLFYWAKNACRIEVCREAADTT